MTTKRHDKQIFSMAKKIEAIENHSLTWDQMGFFLRFSLFLYFVK
jgi:hypothetical protein